MKTNLVKVVLWGRTVGYLSWDDSNWRTETSVFQFDNDFLDSGYDIAPLSGMLHRPGYIMRGGDPKGVFKGLPPVFADSLPDHWGNSLFRAWAKDNGISMKKVTPVDLLSYIGTRGMGALEYLPAAIEGEDIPFDVDVEELYAFAKAILAERQAIEFPTGRELLWQDLIKLGTSPGGKRPKALIAMDFEGNVKSGQATLPEGYKYYILKYDNESDLFPYARLEYAYYLMCRDSGIKMSDSELKPFSKATHFITERFDRNYEGKVHMLSLRAMTGGADSYEEAFDVTRKLMLDYEDKEQLFRRMVFNVLSGNIDDHDRNFSFLMGKDGKWRLSPAYDMVYSIDPDTYDFQKGQFLSINGKKRDITYDDVMEVGLRNDINHPGTIIEQILDTVSGIRRYLLDVGVPDKTCTLIENELNQRHKSFSKGRK